MKHSTTLDMIPADKLTQAKAVRHRHEMQRVAIKGMGFATYRCACGYESDALYNDKAEVERLERERAAAEATLREAHDHLGAMIDQVGHPDYSLRELVDGLRQVRDALLAAAQGRKA